MIWEERMGDLLGEKFLAVAEFDNAVEDVAVEVDYVGALGYIFFLFFLQFYLCYHLI